MKVNIGIPEEQRVAIAGGLSNLLADTYTLYLKTHNFHWNVTGPMFNSLHTMFEGQYNELAVAVDVLAERIRALGEFAPGSFAAFGKLATVKEAKDGHISAQDMLKALTQDHETVARTARSVFPIAEEASDESTADLLVERMRFHEKTAWMLRSMLEG